MLASINPLGERARQRRWGVTVTAYLVGSVVAAAGLGALLGTIGGWLHDSMPAPSVLTAVIIAVACGLGLAFDLRLGGMQLPTVHRQVNKDWLDRYRGWVYGVGFGFQLGLGVVTVVNTAATYLAFALALFSASALGGLAVGATFGLVRGLVILTVSNVAGPEQLRTAHRRMQSWDGHSYRMGIAMQALVLVGVCTAAIAY